MTKLFGTRSAFHIDISHNVRRLKHLRRWRRRVPTCLQFRRRSVSLLDDTINRRTLRAPRLLAKLLKNLLKPLDLLVGPR